MHGVGVPDTEGFLYGGSGTRQGSTEVSGRKYRAEEQRQPSAEAEDRIYVRTLVQYSNIKVGSILRCLPQLSEGNLPTFADTAVADKSLVPIAASNTGTLGK